MCWARLLCCRLLKIWKEDFTDKIFYHISTDEVYGSLGEKGFLQKKLLMIPAALILLQKLHPTIW